MTPEILEYIKAPGLNSSLLGAFADDPIVANSPGEPKTFYQQGKAFERLLQDKATGSDLFGEKFFICEDIKIPESFAEVFKSSKPLTDQFTFTQKGEFHKGKQSLHDVIFRCLTDELYFSGKRRYPVPISEYSQMELAIGRMLKMEIGLFANEFYVLGDLIDGNTLWQFPIYWVANGLKKKALCDIIVLFERRGQGWVLPLDIKFMQSLSSMNMFFRRTNDKYSLQSMHYSEAVNYVEEFEEFYKYPQMPFIVAQKSEPFYVQPFLMDDSSVEYAYSDYCITCERCQKWIDDGRPATGIKPTKRVKIWSN